MTERTGRERGRGKIVQCSLIGSVWLFLNCLVKVWLMNKVKWSQGVFQGG
jgi:hypothetical protein